MTDQNPKHDGNKTITEELEVAGSQLVERVQDLIRNGNVRRLVIKTADDRVLMDTTLTLGAIAGGALALVYWPLAAVAAIAAAVARVKIEVVRDLTEEELADGKNRIEIDDE
jgi:hypothetical protein